MTASNPRRGFIMVIVVGVLIFTMIIFASLVNRVRHESSLTARTSLNEQLNQAASAIGRIVVRKLQRDVETCDKESNKEAVEAILQGKSVKDVPIGDDVRDLDVIQELLVNYSKGRNKMTFDAFYGVIMGDEFPGGGQLDPEYTTMDPCPLEQQGFFSVVVKVTYAGITKSCLINRPFIFSRLIAPPFYKFTLFSPQGANLQPREVNRLAEVVSESSSEIRFKDANKPLVVFNRQTKEYDNDRSGFDFTPLSKYGTAVDPGKRIIKDRDTLSKNGWIYLGGNGNCHPRGKSHISALILNVCSGSNEPIKDGFFGEYFHFFYSEASNGWVAPDKWNDWLNQMTGQSPTNPRVMITYVDFGHMKRRGFSFAGKPLFDRILDAYKNENSGEEYENGSALHLFGTPTICTPTLVFGKVQRRFLRTHSLLFNDIGKVFPLPFTPDLTSYRALATDVVKLLDRKGLRRENDPQFVGMVESFFKDNSIAHQYYLTGLPGGQTNGLWPFFVEEEPYIYGLKNIAKPEDPTDPEIAWASTFDPSEEGDWRYLKDPKKMMEDFSFQSDPYLHYTGGIETLGTLPTRYLGKRTSYYIFDEARRGNGSAAPGQSGPVYLSKCDFLVKTKKILDVTKTPHEMVLNQNIRFKGDLIIDKPIEVLKGGIIMCDGKITINQPFINPWLKKPDEAHDSMGYVTLIAKNGIEFNLSNPAPGRFGYPEFHGFLVALSGGSGEVRLGGGKPVHIIGGVAADKIDDLVKYGGIIEWGFEPGDLINGNDLSHPSFFGLAMGPRDIEILTEGQ